VQALCLPPVCPARAAQDCHSPTVRPPVSFPVAVYLVQCEDDGSRQVHAKPRRQVRSAEMRTQEVREEMT